jgi:serine/threonine protein kinase/tetratricopeptide (TPR) repeat protein
MLQPPQPHNAADPSPMAPPLDPIASLRAALRGHYDIEREIGQGAFATVYLARDLKHERKVAIKVLHADPSSEMGELRFIREIRVLARLQHPNILPLHDSGHVEALLYYVMPYVAGETLRDRINRERQLSVDVACSIARDAADALAYAHGQGIIHRDIKPENILLSAGHPILADFGIARVIGLAGVRQITRPGMDSPGTPAYMSPEQLLGDKELDGRSDTYSLGCVVFEMLTGTPPFAGKDGFVKRFTELPPMPSTIRKDLPTWMDDVVATSLARNPTDRYQTAQELVSALTNAGRSGVERVLPSRTTTPIEELRPESADLTDLDATHFGPEKTAQAAVAQEIRSANLDARQRQWLARVREHQGPLAAMLFAGVAALLTVYAVAKPGGRFSNLAGGITIDTARFVVLPFSSSDHRGVQFSTDLYDEFSQWHELPLVSDTKVAQIVKDKGMPTTENEALIIGRELGAGKVIWGNVTADQRTMRARVHLYDASSRETMDDFVFSRADSGATNYFPVAIRLLGGADRSAAAAACDPGTRSFPAWSACNRAQNALKIWNLPGAEREFRAALESDPDYAAAQLWLAQVEAWTHPSPNSEWQDYATRAASHTEGLAARDRTIAEALVAMANHAYPEACAKYRALTVADSVDFVGWYGLGECQSLDSLVVPASQSPSGWYFRSSNRSAAAAYQRALKFAPAARAIFRFEKLQGLLPTAATKVRMGSSAPSNRIDFLASPTLGAHDTLAFVPYPVAQFNDKAAAASATISDAIAKNTEQLLSFTIAWTQDSNNDPAAFEALADMLEVHGDIDDDVSPSASALSALRRAAVLSTDPTQQLRIKSNEAWVRFKRGEFTEAKRLADDLLVSRKEPATNDAQVLIGLAALTGHVNQVAALATVTGGGLPIRLTDVPRPITAAASKLFANAALGVCGPEITSARKELDDDLDRYIAPAAAPALSQQILGRPLSMLAPCTGGRSALEIQAPRDRTTRMQKAFARGDRKAFKAIGDSVALRIRTRRPGDLSPDFTFQQAWLRAAFGDTTGAIAQLDRSLRALPGLSPPALREAGAAAAIVRAMVLRADLAAQTGDSGTARKWGKTVSILWSNADPSLQPVLKRMQALAGQSRTQ